jgi:hypothetical protein
VNTDLLVADRARGFDADQPVTRFAEMTSKTNQEMMIDSADGHISVGNPVNFSMRGLINDGSPDMRATCGKL